jgi:hypothetical protein
MHPPQACLTEQQVQRHLERTNWCPPYSGYHLCYPSQRQPTPAFALLVWCAAVSESANPASLDLL